MARKEYVSRALAFLVFPISVFSKHDENRKAEKEPVVNYSRIGYESAPPEAFREAYLEGKKPEPEFGYKTA